MEVKTKVCDLFLHNYYSHVHVVHCVVYSSVIFMFTCINYPLADTQEDQLSSVMSENLALKRENETLRQHNQRKRSRLEEMRERKSYTHVYMLSCRSTCMLHSPQEIHVVLSTLV